MLCGITWFVRYYINLSCVLTHVTCMLSGDHARRYKRSRFASRYIPVNKRIPHHNLVKDGKGHGDTAGSLC
uniref:Uncharacterized protein n=1 Tax=Anguilla anguilla TaxID=7936 RepID=A0A0E9WG91_ANGAN